MSSFFSPIIANIVIEDLDKIFLTIQNFLTILSIALIHYINEENKNDRISFLNVTIIIHKKIIFNQYDKPTCFGRYLSFYSHYPPLQKSLVIHSRQTLIVSLTLLTKNLEEDILSSIGLLLDDYTFIGPLLGSKNLILLTRDGQSLSRRK